MIITKTPYRISFFGGGTDHTAWFKDHGGRVLATTFDKYCYISLRNLPPFFDYKYRVVYSHIESVEKLDQIKHPAVREVLKYYKSNNGIEIHHHGDLPARSGLGSSSSFSVGLINAVNALEEVYMSPLQLANTAIHIEQNLIKECVGSQDQISAAYGGFNEIEFYQDGTFSVEPLRATENRKKELNNHLMLFFTGISRFSSEVAQAQVKNMRNCESQMHEIYDMVEEGSSILRNTKIPIEQFGILLDRAWKAKRSLSKTVSNSKIDDLYTKAMEAGAYGGKILGAGGGGFILFFVNPQDQNQVKNALSKLIHVPFAFENTGSKVVIYQPNGI